MPRVSWDEAAVIVKTAWCNFTSSHFPEMLKELVDVFEDSFTLEIYTEKKLTYFTFTADDIVADILLGAFYASLDACMGGFEMHQMPDYLQNLDKNTEIFAAEFKQQRSIIYRIEYGKDFKADPLNAVTNSLMKLPEDDRALIQIVCRPLNSSVALHGVISTIRQFDTLLQPFRPKYWFKRDVRKTQLEAIADKCGDPMFVVTTRIASMRQCPEGVGSREREAIRGDLAGNVEAIMGSYHQLNHHDLNSLIPTNVMWGKRALNKVQRREFGHKMILSHHELSSLWHPLDWVPNTIKIQANHAAPPVNLPKNREDPNISFFGVSNFRDLNTPFGFSRADRRRHLYILGKSGCGKSCMIQLLAKSDMEHGHGLAVIDPHGDLVDELLRLVPKNRIQDVIILDPADRDFPASFNPLAWVPETTRTSVALGIVEIFHKLFGDSWNDHLDQLLRYTANALLSTHDATILSIPKLLTDERYRTTVAGLVSDEGLRSFWFHEYPEWAEKHEGDAVTPLLDVLKRFLASDLIRNIVGQPVNRFDFRSIIDSNKILLVKVSKGLLGDENAALLGSLVVSKIYQAAMSRADIPQEERKDFYFYIDEFHTFAAENMKEILTESRKYGLNLTMAHQFVSQLPASISSTIFGNVGNFLTFCVSGADAGTVSNELSNAFDLVSLTSLPFREFYVKMLVDGESRGAFSGRTLDVVYPDVNYVNECVEVSRTQYALPLKQAKELILNGDSMALRPKLFGEPRLDLRQYLRRYGTKLQLSDLEITDEHLLQLSHAAFDNVKDLILSGTKISDKGLNSVANLKNLSRFDLCGTEITNAGLRALTMLPHLKRLHLERTNITDEGLTALKNTQIRELVLRNTGVTDAAFSALADYKGLVEVALEGTKVSKKGLEKFRERNPRINAHG